MIKHCFICNAKENVDYLLLDTTGTMLICNTCKSLELDKACSEDSLSTKVTILARAIGRIARYSGLRISTEIKNSKGEND